MAYETNPGVQIVTRGRVQLTSKVFNFTDRQDLKLTAGYGHRRKDISSEFIKVIARQRLTVTILASLTCEYPILHPDVLCCLWQGPYGCVQENNWTLVTDFKKYWHVTYDL